VPGSDPAELLVIEAELAGARAIAHHLTELVARTTSAGPAQ
jgi:hypothetical protein